jgi:Zn-dependent peptidase ImmA (M78 family)
MPKASVLAVPRRNPSVSELLDLKLNWSVSVVAMAHRLHALGMITEWHYRTLCIEMAQRGYRKAEPNPITRETSQVLDKVFAALRDEGVTKADVARELRVHVGDLEALVFGLVMVPLVGGAPVDGKGSPKAALRLV